MPKHGDRLVCNLLDDVVGVVVAVGAREDEDAKFHTFRVTKWASQTVLTMLMTYGALLAAWATYLSARCLITCSIELWMLRMTASVQKPA
jgi:hypothetical protein